MWGQGVVATCAVLLLLTGGVAGLSSSRAPQSSTFSGASGAIVVNATGDYGYQPADFQRVPTQANITVTFTDDSVLSHSFTISSREGVVIPVTDTPTQLNDYFVTYPPLLSIWANTSGAQTVATFHSPAIPGWYEFVCLVSGHFQMGMYGFIAFGENLPSNLTAHPRVGLGGALTLPTEAVIGGSLAALAVAGVLLWRRSHPRL